MWAVPGFGYFFFPHSYPLTVICFYTCDFTRTLEHYTYFYLFFLQDTPVLRNKNSKRSKSVQDKISHFFKKIKPSRKQSSSDGELQTAAKAGKVCY